MSEMSNKMSLDNCVEEAGTEGEGFSPGKCPEGKQCAPGCHHATARMEWSK